jgi:hypothetical protein
MFPHQEKVITWDDYGLTVQGEEVRRVATECLFGR